MKVRLAQPKEDNLPWYDYSTMTAINTCPRWGIVRHVHGKTWKGGTSRAMALEAGKACHDVFASVRLFDLWHHGSKLYGHVPDLRDRVYAHGEKLFGKERWAQAWSFATDSEDERTRAIRVGLSILETTGFYDDPKDRRRTLSNLESACIAYIDRYDLGRYIPVVIGDFIGVEVGFNCTLIDDYDDDTPIARFTGRIDGLCHDTSYPGNPIEVHENKTAARLNDAWLQSFEISHQVTGYCVAANAILQAHGVTDTFVDRGVIWGLSIPLPKAIDHSGVMRHPVSRAKHQFDDWVQWVQNTLDIVSHWGESPVMAPTFSHSCNRYFRPCPLIAMCASSPEDRLVMFEDEMKVEKWDPLAESIEDGD